MSMCRVVALCLLAVAARARAQVAYVPSLPYHGGATGDLLGFALGGVGDLNSDGFADFAIGVPLVDSAGADAGSVRVYSGMTGAILFTRNGDSAGDNLGTSVARAGDVNNDGAADFIVGANLDDNTGASSGSVRVYAGPGGTTLYTFNGDSAGDNLGISVAGPGDINNDGRDDLFAGAPLDDNNGANSGSARVYSGINGAILFTFNGDSAGDALGVSVSGAGDVNNDGRPDLIAGAYLDDNNGADSGSARVYSGIDGAVLYTFNGDAAGDRFGYSVSGAGDVNNDGFDDVIVGAALNDINGPDSGIARVFSGMTGAVLHTFAGASGDRLGLSVKGVGDVNNDGFADVLVGAPNAEGSKGSAQVFSGEDGSVLFAFVGRGFLTDFASAVESAGDVNGDGFVDLLIGEYTSDVVIGNAGSAHLILSVPVQTFCPGDADDNRSVNFADITKVLTNFGLSCP